MLDMFVRVPSVPFRYYQYLVVPISSTSILSTGLCQSSCTFSHLLFQRPSYISHIPIIRCVMNLLRDSNWRECDFRYFEVIISPQSIATNPFKNCPHPIFVCASTALCNVVSFDCHSIGSPSINDCTPFRIAVHISDGICRCLNVSSKSCIPIVVSRRISGALHWYKCNVVSSLIMQHGHLSDTSGPLWCWENNFFCRPVFWILCNNFMIRLYLVRVPEKIRFRAISKCSQSTHWVP